MKPYQFERCCCLCYSPPLTNQNHYTNECIFAKNAYSIKHNTYLQATLCLHQLHLIIRPITVQRARRFNSLSQTAYQSGQFECTDFNAQPRPFIGISGKNKRKTNRQQSSIRQYSSQWKRSMGAVIFKWIQSSTMQFGPDV